MTSPDNNSIAAEAPGKGRCRCLAWGGGFWELAILAILMGLVTWFAGPLRTSDGNEKTWAEVQGDASVLWVDARSADEYLSGTYREAFSLDPKNYDEGFAGLAERWDGKSVIVVFCGSEDCASSQGVVLRLRRDLGFERIYSLKGGWPAIPEPERNRKEAAR